MQNYPPGALKSPENPAIPDHIYNIIVNPDILQTSIIINIPKKNPITQSSVFADFLTSV
jgi:hypothetical protein